MGGKEKESKSGKGSEKSTTATDASASSNPMESALNSSVNQMKVGMVD